MTKIKSKTATLIEEIEKQDYVRKPKTEILKSSKQESRTILIARYGMLECGRNFKNSIKEFCECDDENHRHL
jgi:hypothetical protein